MLQDKLYDQISLLHKLLKNPDAPEFEFDNLQPQKVRQELIEHFKLQSSDDSSLIVI